MNLNLEMNSRRRARTKDGRFSFSPILPIATLESKKKDDIILSLKSFQKIRKGL